MPCKADTVAIKDPFLDRRTKLLPCQREMVHYWYGIGTSINGIARIFKVNKRLIQFELFPERKKKNLELRRDRGGTSIYYNKEEHRESTKDHRKYKREILKLTTSDIGINDVKKPKMKIYEATPLHLVRIQIARQKEDTQYLTLVDTTQDEVIDFCRKLIESQNLSIFSGGAKTSINIRSAVGGKNGKSKSISFRGLSAKETYDLILKSIK